MIRFSGRAFLLDVEGTCSSVRYVHDVLFNYARQQLEPYLRSHWDTDALTAAREIVAQETGAESFAAWTNDAPRQEAREQLHRDLMRQIDRDAKTTGLKEVQGLIWREGFEAGKLHTHIYPDVPPSLRRWAEAGRDVRIYSSGSVLTQKLFFANTEVGSLIPFLSGHYDTMIGSKRDNASYAKIAADWGIPAAEIIFLSDIVAEPRRRPNCCRNADGQATHAAREHADRACGIATITKRSIRLLKSNWPDASCDAVFVWHWQATSAIDNASGRPNWQTSLAIDTHRYFADTSASPVAHFDAVAFHTMVKRIPLKPARRPASLISRQIASTERISGVVAPAS